MEQAKNYLRGPLFGPYSFINISCGKEEMDDLRSSRKNIVEVAVVIKIVQNLYKAWNGLREPLSIAIASQYTAQVIEIQDKLGDKYKGFDGFVVNVMRNEELSKKEYDIVILSTVRANSSCSITIPSDHQRIDLASIRARDCLWILGNEVAQLKSDSKKSIIRDAKDRNCFFNVEEDRELHEFVVEVKKELDQLDALLDDDSLLFRNARWKVLFSDNFKKAFERIESFQTKKLVMNLLVRLANGWRPKRRNINITCDRSKHIVKQFKVKSLYVICSIDIAKEQLYSQVLKVWDLLPLVDIPALINRLDDMFLTYTHDFINRCNTRSIEGDLEVPMCWESSNYEIVRYKKSSYIKEGTQGDAKVSDNLLLMKFYAVSSGMVSHMLSGCDGRELELPFELTSQETEVVHFDRSSFVLGRSGTGKTTVLIRKLFQREQLSHIASEGFHDIDNCTSKEETEANETDEETKDNFLRQIFVTLNPRLCHAVKENVSSMKRFVFGGKTPEEEYNSLQLVDIEEMSWFGAIPDSFVNLPSKLFPLSITLHKFLIMLDGTVGISFFDRFPQARGHSHGITKNSKSISLKTFIRIKEVTFDKFDLSYWPHFNKDLTKSLEASTVFTEIMSHIKGGFNHGVAHEKLSLEKYISLSRSRVSKFNEQERNRIYDIFLSYEKLKMSYGEYDVADLVIDLHRRLKESEYNGDLFDFVYVDEVQDLTMRQIALFKYICSNVHNGFFFTGDTAQTIAKGVDFRFEDIRCLFYEEFVTKSESGRKYGKREKGIISDLFHLNENYRTHDGILKLAQSITNLLYYLFPLSIDVLNPETSLVAGQTPQIIVSNGQNALMSMFSTAREDGTNHVGFGAEQVILVRDDNTRNELRKYVGKQALILTISECKGLEFEDVLLYNFLSSSPIERQWRAIYKYMKDQNILNEESRWLFGRFDEAKHSLMCSELKQLYVAITRTKQRLWILEEADEICEPMFDYWKKLQSVEVGSLDDLLAKEIKVTSSKHQWKLRGIELFNQNKYKTARMCFDIAGEQLLEKLAEATDLRASAWNVSCSNSNMAHINLRKAAEIFSSIGKFEASAQCFYESEDYELAGEIYIGKFGNSKLEEAGECFARARLHDRAALAFAWGNFFSNCLDSCMEGKLFEEGINYIDDWKNYATSQNNMEKTKHQITSMEQKLFGSAAINYKNLGDKVMMMKYIKCFHSKKSMRHFLKIEDCLEELLQLENEWGRFQNAADVAKYIGKTMLQVDLLEKAECFNEASSTILSNVLAYSLWRDGGNGWPSKNFVGKKGLLDRAKSLANKGSSYFYGSVCLETKILSNQNCSLHDLRHSLSESKRLRSVRGEILCAWKILDAHFTFGASEYVFSENFAMGMKVHEEDSLSRNQVSIGTLVSIWNFWKKKIVEIFNYLGSLKRKDVYGEFCMNYLGVTSTQGLVNGKIIYLLLCPDAYWVKQISEQYLRRKWDSVGCKAKQFVHAARCYWSSKMLSVGIKVLEKLRDIYQHSRLNSSPLHCRVIPLLYILGIAKWLSDSKFLHHKTHKYNDNTLHGYLKVSFDSFMRDMFPLDWEKLMTPSMAKLREAEEFRRFLDVMARDNICLTRQPTIDKLGKVALMIVTVGGRQCNEICRKVFQMFDEHQSQKGCIEIFGNIKSEHEHISLARKFHKALELIYYAQSFGQSEYISPGGFVYLLERVLITTFCLKQQFFSTKSSFVEWLINKDRNNDASLTSESDWLQHFSPNLDIVAAIIAELLCNSDDVLIWIKNFKLVPRKCHPLLVLRLFVALCLLCVNTRKYHDLLSELLDRKDIKSQLPPEFYDLARKLKPGCSNANVIVLAKAFNVINNPLVIASSGTSIIESEEVQNAIFVDLNAHMERVEMINTLFNKCSGTIRNMESSTAQ